MKRFLFLIACIAAALRLSAAEVTIDATNLWLNEETAGFPTYTLLMEAGSNTATYAIGEYNSAERTIHCVLRGKPQGLEEIVNRQSSIRKLIKDGHIYILRGEQLYDMTGKAMR